MVHSDPVLIIPMTYCIGNNGTPIEILAGFTEENNLLEKLQNAVKVGCFNPDINIDFAI